MTLNEISNTRLISQKIAVPEFNNAKEIVSWMGAIQTQDSGNVQFRKIK